MLTTQSGSFLFSKKYCFEGNVIESLLLHCFWILETWCSFTIWKTKANFCVKTKIIYESMFDFLCLKTVPFEP